ncbi:MAG: DUF4097 domain-containing protein [Clostridia bacterium]|nr:DUF4097 domain-containing protein [Clostridia bacterium]
MITNWNLRKITLWLTGIVVFCFLLGGVILFASGDLGENFSTAHTINEEKAYNLTESINFISIDTFSENIKIIPSDTNELKAHLYGKVTSNSKIELPKLNLNAKGNELIVEIDRKASNRKFINIFSFTNSDIKLDIYIPKIYAKDISIHTSSGDSNLGDLNLNKFKFESFSGNLIAKAVTSKEGIFKTSSGNMQIEELNIGNLNFESFSGNLSVKKVFGTDSTFKTSSGELDINSLNCTGNIKLKSFSGNISLDSLTASEAVFDTSSGDIETGTVNLTKLDSQTFSGNFKARSLTSSETKFKTSSGETNIQTFAGNLIHDSFSGDISVDYTSFNNNIDVKTSSGNVKVKLPETSEFYLLADSSSGDVTTTFPVTIRGSKKDHGLEGTVGTNESNKVQIKTFSGDIFINK